MAGFIVFSIFLITTVAFLIGISIYQARMLSRTPLFQCGHNLTSSLDITCKDKLTIAKDQFLTIKRECIDNNFDLFPPKFREYLAPCLNEYEIGNEVCQSHNKFKTCLRGRASQVSLFNQQRSFKPAVNEYVQILSERLTNSTTRSVLLTITDQESGNGNENSAPQINAVNSNDTTNVTAKSLESNAEVNKNTKNDQIVSDVKEGIGRSVRVGNKVQTEDPIHFQFNDKQINECQKMTACLWTRLDNIPINMDGVEIRSAENAGKWDAIYWRHSKIWTDIKTLVELKQPKLSKK